MNRDVRHPGSECGVYLVLAALFLLMLVGAVFLALAVGFLTVSQTRVQNAANFAALGALQDFQAKESDPNISYEQKLTSALTRANQILNLNQIPSLAGSLGQIEHHGGDLEEKTGTLELGYWCHEEPENQTDPCAGGASYPFFKPNPDYPANNFSGSANAARISISADGTNGLVNQVVGIFGSNATTKLSAMATSSIVQRCSVLLLDASISTTFETHKFNPNIGEGEAVGGAGTPSIVLNNQPTFPALAAYRANHSLVKPAPPGYDPNAFPYSFTDPGTTAVNFDALMRGSVRSICRQPGGASGWKLDKAFFCNMAFNSSCLTTYGSNQCQFRPASGSVPATRHFARDYRAMPSSIDVYDPIQSPPQVAGTEDSILVDSYDDGVYTGPQPFSRYMMAFNAALRSMQSQRVAGDRVAALIMTGKVRDRVPDTGMAMDLGYLINLFNWKNRGTIDGAGVFHAAVHPNAVDRGWVPLLSFDVKESSTSLVEGISEAINVLANPNFCPETAQKSIMFATDGAGTCYFDSGSGSYVCGTDYNSYLQSERQLALNSDSLLTKLISSKIAITFILDGEYVQPNVVNRWYDKNGNGVKDADEFFLTADEASAVGYGGINSPSGKNFVDYSSQTPTGSDDANAFDNLGNSGFFFRRPNGVLAKMSMETGGLFCPLMDLCPNTTPGCDGECYTDHDSDPTTPMRLKEGARVDGARQTCAVINLNKAEQAAKCAIDTLGRNPFILVEQ